eukprot:Lithocolla_globosa_v1_NODE_1187_length_2800_cov_7.195993.p2 type:complete len:220 gc:universal NODE_1187_length_2800_cov_7.195993:1733-2392(+)
MSLSTLIYNVNQQGGVYFPGHALSAQRRYEIVNDCAAELATGTLHRKLSCIGVKNRTSGSVVGKIFTRFLEKADVGLDNVSNGGVPLKMTDEVLDVVRIMKSESPSMPYWKLINRVRQYCGVNVSPSTLSHALTHTHGMSWKKMSTTAYERFTMDNMIYTGNLINFLQSVEDKSRIRWFDESSVVRTVGVPKYGHSRVGEKAVEVVRWTSDCQRSRRYH